MMNHAVMLLAEGDLTSAFTTGLTQVKTDVLSYVGVALPIALGIVGVFLAVRLGIRFFKSVSK